MDRAKQSLKRMQAGIITETHREEAPPLRGRWGRPAVRAGSICPDVTAMDDDGVGLLVQGPLR